MCVCVFPPLKLLNNPNTAPNPANSKRMIHQNMDRTIPPKKMGYIRNIPTCYNMLCPEIYPLVNVLTWIDPPFYSWLNQRTKWPFSIHPLVNFNHPRNPLIN